MAYPAYQVLSYILFRLGLMLSPVLARYDPFGVDVPLNFDNTHSILVWELAWMADGGRVCKRGEPP